ncbi:hypothetical protein EDD86DRAFT_247866 [Gorgonomyces haynaldii]|nr:hypothetical protein EDD86DRAFT_247866 [Gorgonomyces haynaldii]
MAIGERVYQYAIIHLLQIVTAVMLMTCILLNAHLLFIRNYHFEPQGPVFNAGSSGCANMIALGAGGIVMGLLSIGQTVAFHSKQRSDKTKLVSTILASMCTVISFVGAVCLSIGIHQTCSEFSKQQLFTCSESFSNGFFQGSDTSVLYKLSLDGIYTGVASAWALFLSWLIYTGMEFSSWRHHSDKWW